MRDNKIGREKREEILRYVGRDILMASFPHVMMDVSCKCIASSVMDNGHVLGLRGAR